MQSCCFAPEDLAGQLVQPWPYHRLVSTAVSPTTLFKMKAAVIFFLVATFVAAAADDATFAAGQCDAEDAQALLQSRVSIAVLDSVNDADMEALGAFKYLPEKASDQHSNDKGYEVFTEVKDACDACDVACEDKQLKAAFVLCDDDKNKKLTVDEVHDCMFDGDAITAGTKPDHAANVNASDAVLTPAKAAQFVKDHDADGSNDLTEDEFLDACAPPCNGIATLEENTTIATTRSVAKCISTTVDKVTKAITEKCARSVPVRACWSSWEFWKGSFWSCRWKTVIETYDCVKNKIVDIVTKIGAGFADCYKNVIDEVKKKAGGPFMDLLDACSNPDSCKKHLLAGPKKLYDKVVDEAKSELESLVLREPLRTGVTMTDNLLKKVPPLAADLADVAIDVGTAVVKMVKKSAKAIREEPNLNMCTPSGYGYWSFAPTDCGAFDRLKDILKISGWIWDIPAIFEDVVNKFAGCVSKRSIFSLPTPFLNVDVKRFCVPDILQVPVKGIVGTFRYIMAQMAAGVNGCSGSSEQQPVCQMAKDIKKIGQKMKTAFSSSLLQQTAEVVGSELHGDQSRYTGGTTADCAGEDFKVFIELSGTASFPGKVPDSITLSFVSAIGCRKKKLFVDLVFGLGGDLFIAGFKVEPPSKISTGGAVAIGFEVGTPSEDIVSWQGSFKIVGSATVAGATGQLELGFKVLPSLDYPKGFKVQPVVEAGSLLAQQARQQEIDNAVEKAETVEDKVYKAAGTMLRHMRNLDVTEMFQAAQFMSEMRRGAASIKGQAQSEGWPYPKEASLTAGLAVEFCLTCGLNAVTKSAAGASDNDAGALIPKMPKACTDTRPTLCPQWAKHFCTGQWASWMATNCAKSCSACS